MAVKAPTGGAVKARFTSEELQAIQAALGRSYELVKGELFEVAPPNVRHGRVTVRTARKLDTWAEEARAGQVVAESGYTLERNPDTVRGPDVSFIAKGRISAEQARAGFPDLAPDLAIEVRSPNETWPELEEKAREYFAAGSRMVWFVEMDEFLEVLRPNVERRRLGLDDTIEADDVLPGFRCKVREFFPEEV